MALAAEETANVQLRAVEITVDAGGGMPFHEAVTAQVGPCNRRPAVNITDFLTRECSLDDCYLWTISTPSLLHLS